MLSFQGKKVYLACGPTDMRKQINGLAAIVEQSFGLSPFEGAVFVFCNRRKDRIKVLEWDRDGFWLHLKRLERGRFSWPARLEEGERTITLSADELGTLISATSVERVLRREQVAARSCA